MAEATGRAAEGVGPCEAGWRHNFAVVEARGLPKARVLAPPGELPILALPAGLAGEDREAACALAICRLFMACYGAGMLGPAIAEWPRFVELVPTGAGEDEGCAAD